MAHGASRPIAGIPSAAFIERQFRPGESGNPSGRTRGAAALAAYIRERTHDGRDIIDAVWALLFDERKPDRVRLEAAAFLADRGFGRPIMGIELGGEGGGPMQIEHRVRLASEEIDALIAARERHRALLARPAAPLLISGSPAGSEQAGGAADAGAAE